MLAYLVGMFARLETLDGFVLKAYDRVLMVSRCKKSAGL